MFKRRFGNVRRFLSRLPEPARLRYQQLSRAYSLDIWSKLCIKREFVANLYLLDILDHYCSATVLDGPALDVGSAQWWYLPALRAFWPRDWTGIDLPARERSRRVDRFRFQATRMAAAYPNTRYQAKCITEMTGRFALITWFLPYVAIDPMLSAGLPAHRFDPAGMLRHVWDLLEPGGTFFIVNQGTAEAALQQKILAFEQLAAKGLGELKSVFTPFRYPRYGWLLERQ